MFTALGPLKIQSTLNHVASKLVIEMNQIHQDFMSLVQKTKNWGQSPSSLNLTIIFEYSYDTEAARTSTSSFVVLVKTAQLRLVLDLVDAEIRFVNSSSNDLLASISVGPWPSRARWMATRAASNIAAASLPSTVTPGMP